MEAVRPTVSVPSRPADSRRTVTRRPQFFQAKSHAPIWRALRTALLRAEGLILITGVEGSGKSTLIRRLPGMIPDNRDLAVIQTAALKDAEFLRQLIAACTLARDESGALVPVEDEALDSASWEENESPLHPTLTLQDLMDALEERVAMGRKLVLVVDNAQSLTPVALTWLDMVVRFVSEEIRPVQLVLVGHPETRTLLDAETGIHLADQLVGSAVVTPLTRIEVWEYLQFQFRHQLESPVKLSLLAWVEIYGFSQGIPLKIDQLIKRLFSLVRQRNAREINRATVRLAMTMGRPMTPGSFLGLTPKQRLAAIAGGVIMLFGSTGYLAGWFDATPPEGEAVVVKKGAAGENTSYVKIIQPENPAAGATSGKGDKSEGRGEKGAKPEKSDKSDKGEKSPEKPTDKSDKPAASKESKPTEDKGEDKSAGNKKRYWEPNMPVRPETPPTPQTLERLEAMAAAIDKLTAEPQPPRPAPPPDPESFRRRYQSAKVISSNAPAESPSEGTATPTPASPESPDKPTTPEARKSSGITPPTPVPLKNPRTGQVYDPFLARPAKDVAPPVLESASEDGGVPIIKARDLSRKPATPPPAPATRVASAPPPVEKNEPAADVAEKSEEKREEKRAEKREEPRSAPAKPVLVKPKPSEVPLPKISGVATERSFRAVGRVYVVQTGSFAKVDGAEQLKQTLTGNGRGDAYVHLYERKGKKLYSVRFNYRSRDAAERMARTIQEQDGLSTKVMELNYD
ncbi:MAG: AAA family ATPase [Magnetococcus sp. YQC-9]